MYNRKIIYLHRYEGEMDKGNVGYIKEENYNGICTFTVVLMNMPSSYVDETALVVYPAVHTLCKVHIGEGKGQGVAICEEKQLEQDGVLFEKIEKYEIKISDEIILWGEKNKKKTEKNEITPFGKSEEKYKSKWEHLADGKKRVNLMGKESDYVEISPGDMIALSTPYHGLVNNAFLLHGYHNYNHLILGPAKGSKSNFFIGVPGNFYKQEVNAARMFGFEYFENGSEKVEVGDFGYYMKKVKL